MVESVLNGRDGNMTHYDTTNCGFLMVKRICICMQEATMIKPAARGAARKH